MNLKGVLEGMLFVIGDEGLSIEEIICSLETDEKSAKDIIKDLEEDYKSNNRGLQLSLLGNKYKLTTKEEHKEYFENLANNSFSSTLTQAALEVLAIIAYNEPVTVGQIDEYRGVYSRDIVRKLVFRELVVQSGRSEMPGKPMLYKTTNKFLDYFNLSTLENLPEIIFKEENDEIKELYS